MKPSPKRLERQALKAVVALYRADLARRTTPLRRRRKDRTSFDRAMAESLFGAYSRALDAVLRAGRVLDDARADKRRKERQCEACRGHVAPGKTCYACGRAGRKERSR